MRNAAKLVAVLCVTAVVMHFKAVPVSADEKQSIEHIMETTHKGKEAPITVIGAGKADEKLIKKFLADYEFMATQKAPVGDDAAFKKKVAAVIAALKGIEAKKPGAVEEFKAAANCKACHTDHKPKK